ncbi:N-acylneuraminate cytidylyltransferase-like [Styela clava]|uniref:N-acylneuraminate cytidylyltransferase-like n=1 Tax=Styela clava TaxID=7725 RepID=UPI00193A4382|nr:N-acylneuraminate cytidylyltransferase-like [Styela clava]XP_039254532.1 N-acylneuraminate cytidylyltransferase-like [Styela clava]
MTTKSLPWDPKTCHMAALVLARGGSKGLPLKNIRPCAGLPLIGWVLRAIGDSEVFDSIWVSTDHEDIAKVSEQFGAKVHWRSDEVSQDTTSSVETSREFLNHHPEVEFVCMIQCTSPALHPFHLRDLGDLVRNRGYESVFSVVRKRHFRWKEVDSNSEERTVPLNIDPTKRPRRQEWKGELFENGSFYSARRHLVFESSFQAGNLTYYEMSQEHSIDIDTEFDLQMAEIILQKYGYKGKEAEKSN